MRTAKLQKRSKWLDCIDSQVFISLWWLPTEADVEGGALNAVQRGAVVATVEHGLADVRPVRALAGRQRR